MSTSKRCRTFNRSIPDPLVCACYLGEFIQGARSIDGRPLEEIAPLAGLKVEEWKAIEDGDGAAYCWEQMLLIAQALRRGPIWMSYLAKFYRGARQQ